MNVRLIISIILLFPLNVNAFTFNRVLGYITPCVSGAGSLLPSEAALGCVAGALVCDATFDSLGSTSITCPDIDPPPDPDFVFNHIGATMTSISLPNTPYGTESDVARTNFNSWSASTPVPDCPAPYVRGVGGDGYIFSTTMAADGINSDIHMTMWRRADCSVTGNNTVLNPIFPIGGGSGGSTDMTATNALLASIQTNTAGLVSPGAIDVNIVSGGGGGVATDMTATNNLIGAGNTSLGSIDNAVSGVSTLPSQGVPAAVNAYLSSNLSDHIPTVADYTTEYNTFKTNMEATSLYGLIAGFFSGVPAGGSSVYSFNGGVFGNHSYDFASWGSIMTLLRGLTLVAFGAASLRIIFLKGGS